jgi:hypothetical protein
MPRGFIRLTNVNTAFGNPRIAVRAIASYDRKPGAQHTVVTLLTHDETSSDVYHVRETDSEIDLLIDAAMAPLGFPDYTSAEGVF